MNEYGYDKYGRYEILASVYYEENRVTIDYLKYSNSKAIKSLGGMYCLHCIETDQRVFRKNDHICMLSLPKFIEFNSNIVDKNLR